MRALVIDRYGMRPEIRELPKPTPGPNDLLVRVRAASVNPVDYKIRDGGVKIRRPTPSSVWRRGGTHASSGPAKRSSMKRR